MEALRRIGEALQATGYETTSSLNADGSVDIEGIALTDNLLLFENAVYEEPGDTRIWIQCGLQVQRDDGHGKGKYRHIGDSQWIKLTNVTRWATRGNVLSLVRRWHADEKAEGSRLAGTIVRVHWNDAGVRPGYYPEGEGGEDESGD